MTLHEREEDRLWNGAYYFNLPDQERLSKENVGDWKVHEATIHPDSALTRVQQGTGQPETVPFGPVGGYYLLINDEFRN